MKLPKYLVLNKEIGETPLEVLENFKSKNHAYAAVPMSYAGRLDPLASGKLLVLVGEECKKQHKYMGLDKEYEFEVLLGMTTDTGDVLGMGELGKERLESAPEREDIMLALRKLSGKRTIPYPAFSSKTVNGVPLFKQFCLKYMDTKKVSIPGLFSMISEKIESIKPVTEHKKALGNDFRRPDIRVRYKALEDQSGSQDFYILKCKCICSSGTYMRTLAEDIAQALGFKGLAFSIHRTKVGRYTKIGPVSFWSKLF